MASTGREGLARFETGRYDLVLTDLGMPDLNGWDVVRAIKAARPDTSVMHLTGWSDAPVPSAQSSVDGVVKKPCDIGLLAAEVGRALAGRR